MELEGTGTAPSAGRRPGAGSVVSKLWRNRLYVPAHLNVLLQDVLQTEAAARDRHASLKAAMEWLARAQDNGRGGVAGYYSFATGWNAPYPETTGYIIPTMFDYAALTGDEDYRERAVRLTDWEVGIQLPDGAFPGGYTDSSPGPIVFNTGQVLQGLVRTYTETQSDRYLEAARKAGDWLAEVQDADGAWTRHTYRNTFHTYHTRVAWPLLQLHAVTAEPRHAEAARKNLDWALRNQQENGWFRHNALYLRTDRALTHSIAYAIRGFLESSQLLADETYFEAAKKTADVMLETFESTGGLQASYGPQWDSKDRYACVTGNAQMSGIWFRLYAVTGEARYRDAARRMNDLVTSTQNVSSSNSGIRGGIKGSQPISGGYMPFCYINWATKFFADALMLEARCSKP